MEEIASMVIQYRAWQALHHWLISWPKLTRVVGGRKFGLTSLDKLHLQQQLLSRCGPKDLFQLQDQLLEEHLVEQCQIVQPRVLVTFRMKLFLGIISLW
jgi:hypothetical protein